MVFDSGIMIFTNFLSDLEFFAYSCISPFVLFLGDTPQRIWRDGWRGDMDGVTVRGNRRLSEGFVTVTALLIFVQLSYFEEWHGLRGALGGVIS